MTTAVCLKCGAFKLGAFTPCSKCGFMPESDEDRAKGILLSDHSMDRPRLEAISAQIAAGNPPEFDESDIAAMANDISQIAPPSTRDYWGCLLVKWLLIGTMLALAANLAYMVWKMKSAP